MEKRNGKISLSGLSFDEVVTDILKVKAGAKTKETPRQTCPDAKTPIPRARRPEDWKIISASNLPNCGIDSTSALFSMQGLSKG